MEKNLFSFLETNAGLVPDKICFEDPDRSFTYKEAYALALCIGTEIQKTVCCTEKPVGVLVGRNAVSPVMLQGVLAGGNAYVPLDSKMPVPRLLGILKDLHPAALVYAQADEKLADEILAGLNSAADASAAGPSGQNSLIRQTVLSEADPLISQTDLSDAEPLISQTDLPLICAESVWNTLPENGLIREEMLQTMAKALSGIRESLSETTPAYIIFTSGSTGKPKGIVVGHRSIIGFTRWMNRFCGYTAEEVFGNQAPFYFDLSGKDLYQTLSLGATCVVFPKKYFSFPSLLVKAMNEKRVTAINWATSSFHLVAAVGILEKESPLYLRKAALGGEALQACHVNTWKRAVSCLHVINMYGPTEVTVDCTAFHLERDYADGEAIPIGTAIDDKEVLLLDDALQPVAPGEPGEICVKGPGLALGYFNDPEKTAASFVTDPAVAETSSYIPGSLSASCDRIYRTGDMAYERDGLFYFLSRRDGQIKHMGYRIELGEIENALYSVTGVDAAVCFYNKDAERIVAVYSGTAEDRALAKTVRGLLPKYMLPNVYVKLGAMPYNANGKIDRVLLREKYCNE